MGSRCLREIKFVRGMIWREACRGEATGSFAPYSGHSAGPILDQKADLAGSGREAS